MDAEEAGRSVVLETRALSIGYRQGRARRMVAENISVALRRGELVCLLGPNGAGKSTLMRTLAGMQPPLAGTVLLDAREINTLSAQERAHRLSIVLTERIEVGNLTARDLVALGRYPYTDWMGRMTARDEAAVQWAIEAVGMQALAPRSVLELSDGERQKVLIARALAQEPDLILLDEPTAFLDLPRRVEIMTTLRTLAHAADRAVLLSTHDLDLALRSADRIWLLPPDGVLHRGTPEDLILDGSFAQAFASEGVHFDVATGSFRIQQQQTGIIHLTGEGLATQWTHRALERRGYRVTQTDGTAPVRIQVMQIDGAAQWRVETHEAHHVAHSIAELLTHLDAHQAPRTARTGSERASPTAVLREFAS
jgi:iron complex transport system ATP-binding protein